MGLGFRDEALFSLKFPRVEWQKHLWLFSWNHKVFFKKLCPQPPSLDFFWNSLLLNSLRTWDKFFIFLIFWKQTPLEFLDLSLYTLLEIPEKTSFHPWQFCKIVCYPLEIPSSKTKNHGNSTWVFFWTPLEIPFLSISICSFFNTPGNFMPWTSSV